MKAWLVIAASLPLAACLPEAPPRMDIPRSLLRCKDNPKVPPAPRTQSMVAGYTVDLEESSEDCRSKLGKVRGLYEGAP